MRRWKQYKATVVRYGLSLFIIGTCTSIIAQSKQDYVEIIELVVDDCRADSAVIYNKFMNKSLMKDLRKNREHHIEDQIASNESQDLMSLYANNSLVLDFEGISYNHNHSQEVLKKAHRNKLRRYYKNGYRSKGKPINYLSFPLISANKKHALIKVQHYCGPLCGSSGYYLLKWENGKWGIEDFVLRSVS